MSVPEPMLSVPVRSWPAGGAWVLQPKWDGFRCLIDVGGDGRVRAWSRHGVSLTGRLGDLLAGCPELPRGSLLDGELIALAERQDCPVQDFAAVRQAVFTGDARATERLCLVAFDLLRLDRHDLRDLPWNERDQLLREIVPVSARVRMIGSRPASEEAHAALLDIGFEGSVLKRPTSSYRPGRHSSWRKLKARHCAAATVRHLKRARDGQTFAICDLEGRRVVAAAGATAQSLVGQAVDIVYSRVDADGTLREARIAQPARVAR